MRVRILLEVQVWQKLDYLRVPAEKEKVITQTRVDGFILPPGTYMKISAAEFDSAQEARILNLIRSITDPLEQRIRDLENREST